MLIGNKKQLKDQRTIKYEKRKKLADKYRLIFFARFKHMKNNSNEEIKIYIIVNKCKKYKQSVGFEPKSI